ncbi:MAG: lytic transglycosylase domain-containing protein [Nitrospinota bacterium]|nr:lytic transglycosylase domain-containing protein [Nitrospinota bacterium]
MKRISSKLPKTVFLYLSLIIYGAILPMAGQADLAEESYAQALDQLRAIDEQAGGYPLQRDIFQVVSQRAPLMSGREQWKLSRAVARYSVEHGHDPYLLLAVIEIESAYKHDAVSNKGAVGFMQVRPFVARGIAGEVNINPVFAAANLTNLDTNLRLGSYYLSKMKNRFGSLDLALVAYNLGPTLLSKYLKDGKTPDMKYSLKVLASRKKIKQTSRVANAQKEGNPAGV